MKPLSTGWKPVLLSSNYTTRTNSGSIAGALSSHPAGFERDVFLGKRLLAVVAFNEPLGVAAVFFDQTEVKAPAAFGADMIVGQTGQDVAAVDTEGFLALTYD